MERVKVRDLATAIVYHRACKCGTCRYGIGFNQCTWQSRLMQLRAHASKSVIAASIEVAHAWHNAGYLPK